MKATKKTLKVLFYLKKKNLRNGLCPVMGRIRIGKSMAQFSCKLEANPALWNTRAGRMDGKSSHAGSVNREIDKINLLINARYKELISAKEEVSAVEVKEAYQGIASSQETLIKLFREHNDDMEKRIGLNYALNTWKIYETSLMHLQCFIKKKYCMTDISFKQLDLSFIKNYDYYLRVELRQMPKTVLKQVTTMRKIIMIAIERGIIRFNPFSGYMPEQPQAKHRYLPKDELALFMECKDIPQNLMFVRDVFVFSCFTGLSFIDIYHLSNEHIVKADDGTWWLKINRQKTKVPSNIPLLKIPQQIVEKYQGITKDNRLFPMFKNNTVNQYLKKIAEKCGIKRRLTFHMARHTFGTETCLSQGVPIETVSRMMGHQKISTTQLYAAITNEKISEDMKALSEKIKNRYKLVSIDVSTN